MDLTIEQIEMIIKALNGGGTPESIAKCMNELFHDASQTNLKAITERWESPLSNELKSKSRTGNIAAWRKDEFNRRQTFWTNSSDRTSIGVPDIKESKEEKVLLDRLTEYLELEEAGNNVTKNEKFALLTKQLSGSGCKLPIKVEAELQKLKLQHMVSDSLELQRGIVLRTKQDKNEAFVALININIPVAENNPLYKINEDFRKRIMNEFKKEIDPKMQPVIEAKANILKLMAILENPRVKTGDIEAINKEFDRIAVDYAKAHNSVCDDKVKNFIRVLAVSQLSYAQREAFIDLIPKAYISDSGVDKLGAVAKNINAKVMENLDDKNGKIDRYMKLTSKVNDKNGLNKMIKQLTEKIDEYKKGMTKIDLGNPKKLDKLIEKRNDYAVKAEAILYIEEKIRGIQDRLVALKSGREQLVDTNDKTDKTRKFGG